MFAMAMGRKIKELPVFTEMLADFNARLNAEPVEPTPDELRRRAVLEAVGLGQT